MTWKEHLVVATAILIAAALVVGLVLVVLTSWGCAARCAPRPAKVLGLDGQCWCLTAELAPEASGED